MKKILRFEFDKLFCQRSFYICTIIMAVLVLINALSTNAVSKAAEGFDITGWKFAANAISNSQFQMIIGIFTSLFVCEDFDQNTLKNIISKGYGRQSVYIAKYISSLCAMLIMYCVVVLLSFTVGSAMWGIGSSGDYSGVIIAQLIVLAAYHALFYAVAIILGKTGGSIAVSIVSPMIVGLVLTLGDNILKLKNIKFNDFWLDSFMKTASDAASSAGELTISLILSVIYAAAFFAAGAIMIRKREI